MDFHGKSVSLVVGTSATVDLPEDAVLVKSVSYVAEGEASFSAASLTLTTSAPADANHVQFTGTPAAPSKTLTLDAAPATAGGLLQVEYLPVGSVPNNA